MTHCEVYTEGTPSTGTLLQIVRGVHKVPGVRWSAVYLIDDVRLTLVDTGPPWTAGKVAGYVASIGRRMDEIDVILMTHGHPDHISSAPRILRRTDADIYAHVADTTHHPERGRSLSYMGLFGGTSLPFPLLERAPVSHLVDDGDTLPFMGGIRVVHTPGHTPGSLSFLLEERGLLFSGDSLFSDGARLSRSMPFPGSSIVDYRRSLERLATLKFEALCGGHGQPLVGRASDKLRDLLETSPDPPTWGRYLRSIPSRIYRARSLTGELY